MRYRVQVDGGGTSPGKIMAIINFLGGPNLIINMPHNLFCCCHILSVLSTSAGRSSGFALTTLHFVLCQWLSRLTLPQHVLSSPSSSSERASLFVAANSKLLTSPTARRRRRRLRDRARSTQWTKNKNMN